MSHNADFKPPTRPSGWKGTGGRTAASAPGGG